MFSIYGIISVINGLARQVKSMVSVALILDHAVRACFKLLVNYILSGHDTYRKIINRFAPPSENDTQHYLDFVCDNPFIDPDHEVVTYDDLLRLMAKMAKMENGINTNHIDLALILQAYETNFNIYSRIKM